MAASHDYIVAIATLHVQEDIMFTKFNAYIRQLFIVLGFAALITGLASITLVSPAQAEETPTVQQTEESTPTPVININISADAEAELEVDTVTTLNTNANGEFMMRPLQDHQLTDRDRRARALHWLLADALKCPTVANQPTTQAGIKAIRKTSFVKKGAALKRFKKAVPSAKVTKKFPDGRQTLTVRCYWVKVGGKFTDTGVDPNGKKRGMANTVGGPGTLKRPMLFDTAVTTVKVDGQVVVQEISRRRGQNAPGSNVVGYGDCLNPKAKVVDVIKFVYAWSWSKFRQHIQGDLRQRLHVAGRGRVESSNGNCSVEYEYDFLTEGSLEFDQILWAKSKAAAVGLAGSAAASTDISSDTDVTGSIRNSLEAQLRIAFGEQCEGTPPPAFEAPTVDVTPVACVNPGQTRDVTITVSNPNDIADTARVTYRGNTTEKAVAAHGQVTFTFANQAAGTYSGTALLVNANKSKSFTVTVEECPTTPPDITEITTINDVVEYNVRTVDVMGTGTPGETLNLFATAKHGGSITAGKNQTVTVDGNGNWSATVEYTAGETPKSSLTYEVDGDPYTIAAGKDVIWFKASNAAGQYVWAKSNDFDITPRPVTP